MHACVILHLPTSLLCLSERRGACGVPVHLFAFLAAVNYSRTYYSMQVVGPQQLSWVQFPEVNRDDVMRTTERFVINNLG